MMNIKYFIVALFVCFSLLGQAQKYGHLNSQQLLMELPEVKEADNKLVAYQKQLENDFAAKGTAFENEYKAFLEKANSGNFTDVQLQKEQESLTIKQQNLQKLQSESQQKILLKREELFAPILKKVEDAIKMVGKENGYTMIFDSSLGVMLHGDDSLDVYASVKAKLGL